MIHICSKRDARWQKLPSSCIVATQYPKPDGLSSHRWAQNISPDWYSNGEQMGQAIIDGLRSEQPPCIVMIDELKKTTVNKVTKAAQLVSLETDLRGKFGAYLVNGTAVSYALLNPAIDALLDGGALIAPEMYLKASEYERLGQPYLTKNILGTDSLPRLQWLLSRRASRNSSSLIVGLVGLTSVFLDAGNPMKLIRAIRGVWESVSPGPMGAWKWDEGTGAGVSPSWPGWGAIYLK